MLVMSNIQNFAEERLLFSRRYWTARISARRGRIEYDRLSLDCIFAL